MRQSTTDVRSNGLRFTVRTFLPDQGAPEAGRSVFLIHGFLDASSTWDRVAEALTGAGYRVLAPDLRGFGSSDRVPPGGYYHFADYVADLDGLVDTLVPAEGAARPWLAMVGHSMGGVITSLWCGTRPDRVQRVANLEGAGPPRESAELAPDRMRSWLRDLGRIDRAPRPVATVENALDRLAATHPRIDRAVLEERVQQLLVKEGDQLRWAYDPIHRSRSPIAFQPDSFKAFLAQIECPFLYLDGGPTGWHPEDEEDRLASVRDLRRVTLPDAGHMMHWTEPDRLARELLGFFD